MSEMNNSSDCRRSLEDSNAFMSGLRNQTGQPSDQPHWFWSDVFKRKTRDERIFAGFRDTVKDLVRQSRKKFILGILFVNAVLFGVLYLVFFHSQIRYQKAEELLEAGDHAAAMEIFLDLSEKDYKDSQQMVTECQRRIDTDKYTAAMKSYGDGDLDTALTRFQEISYFQDSAEYIRLCKEQIIAGYQPLYVWEFSGTADEKSGLSTETAGNLLFVPVMQSGTDTAISFTDRESSISAPAKIDLSGNWTVSLLLRSEEIHRERITIVSYSVRTGGLTQSMEIGLTDGKLSCLMHDGRENAFALETTQSIEMHQWYLLSVAKQGESVALYVNDQMWTKSSYSGNYAPDENAGDAEPEYLLQIGKGFTDETETAFVGDISRLGIYGTPLGKDQLGMLMQVYMPDTGSGAQTADIPANAFQWEGHHYAVLSNCVTLPEAIDYCAKRGGYLASVNSAQEDEMLHAATSKPVVIGLTTQDGGASWQWVNGENVTYHGIAADCDPAEPGERYYARFARTQGNTGWYLCQDMSGKKDKEGNPVAQEPFVFLCEWDS